MPTFTTAGPVAVKVEVGVGQVHLAAEEGVTAAAVEVRPADPTNSDDVAAAERTTVDGDTARLVVRGPRSRRPFRPGGRYGAVEVTVTVAAGSSLDAKLGVASLHATGRLGDCRATAGIGDIVVEVAGTVHLGCGSGDIAVDRATGPAHLSSATGEIRAGVLERGGTVKSSNGPTWVEEAAGDVRIRAANGDIAVTRAAGDVTAKTAHGDVRVQLAARGRLSLGTATGAIHVGVVDGTATWLDVQTSFGKVRNDLAAGAPAADGEDRLEVHARTATGDITVRRVPQDDRAHV